MGRKDLDKKKHQALLREHQKIKALKKKGKVVVKGKKKNIGYFETQKEDQEEKYQKKRPRKRSRTITKKPKKLPKKKSLPRKEKKWHKSLMLRNIHCTCNEFLKNQRAKKLLNKRLLDSVILKKL